ncbi:hypothetical protein UA08_07945 [Talaromyces atroroseus]|uniref:Uncharacterized protein n=1 Tax=Talaromyces atroroseus TaxID=1441469 RepID=A0A225AU64_TALAT|nr:hypothetical protein UA08_07945 [Talaromyces atroroseus]OKL57007.1 hypothetical protein UA08_07945 [Talaromyces atroroseus]
MDEGAQQREQQHAHYNYPSVSGAPRHVVQQQVSPAQSPESFRRTAAAAGSRRRRGIRSSGSAGPNFVRAAQQRQSIPSSALHFQQPPNQHVLGLQPGQYDTGVIYNFDQSGTAQIPYTMPLPVAFTARHAEPLSALSPGVSQFFSPPGHNENASQYLSPQVQLAIYQQQQQQQQSALDQRTAGSLDTTIMANFNPTGAAGTAPNVANPHDASNQYHQALLTVFGYTQRGQLNEASRLLLELSTWLIGNARELGLLQDDPDHPKKNSQLWEDFNICWLSLCQKQKDLTEAILGAGQALPSTLLSAEAMESMGQAIIQFCDTVEPHGLVDYQMGIWEEEILDILGQCLDLVEQ